MLLVWGRANFTNLSRYSDLNEKTYRRHYAKTVDFDALHLWSIGQATEGTTEQIAVMDCSFIPKSGKKTEGLDYFFNGSHSKCERGLEWSLLSIVDLKQNSAYPLNVQQTPAQLTTVDETSSETTTRIDWYLKQLRQARKRLPSLIQYLAADAYYSKKKWIDGIVALELHAIGKLRRDSRLKYFYNGPQKPRGRRRKFAGLVDYTLIDSPPEHAFGFEFVKTVDDIDLYRAWVYSESFKRAIQVVYLHKVTPTSSSYVLLYCTDEHLSAVDVYRYYKARFQIEFIFRDSKQFLGVTHCQARDSRKLNFHVNSVLLTLNLLKVHWAKNTTDSGERQAFSVANYKRLAFNEYMLSTFISRLGLEQTLDKSQDEYRQCLELGLITS